jgi:hypothetical protein
MYKNIILFGLMILFSGCVSTNINILKFGELDDPVAKKDIKNNFISKVLHLTASGDTESLTVLMPKDDMTVLLELKIPNIEDVLYINIVDESDFKINKLIRRVSDVMTLDNEQDGWSFEPSVKKGIITLQLWIPQIYLYNGQYNPKLIYSFKRDGRALQDSITLHFVRQKYYPSLDANDQEIGKFGTLKEYCKATGVDVSSTYLQQLGQLNSNRISEEFKTKLREICQ